MRAWFAAGALALVGCVPTLELKDGAERERLLGIVRQFCEAERSPDPHDSAALFDGALGGLAGNLPPAEPGSDRRFLTSRDSKPVCEPGRTWYLGGSRTFAEVRLQSGSDRLDLWRSSEPKISDILYGRSRRVGGRKVGSLRAALAAAAAPRATGED